MTDSSDSTREDGAPSTRPRVYLEITEADFGWRFQVLIGITEVESGWRPTKRWARSAARRARRPYLIDSEVRRSTPR